MPFVKISSLPGGQFNRSAVMEAMEDDFAENAGLPIGTSSFIWQSLDCITHRQAGQIEYRSSREFNPSEKEIPIFVDLYVTSVFNYESISKIMGSITKILQKKTQIPREYIFIHAHIADPGHVYISGGVWPCELKHPGCVKNDNKD